MKIKNAFAELILVFLYLMIPEIAMALIADISQHKIWVNTNFTGTELIVFGAVENNNDLSIVITGPSSIIKINKKNKIFGIWVNTEQTTLNPLPLLYFVRSSRAVSNLTDRYNLTALKIGLATLFNSTNSEEAKAFRDHQIKKGLYVVDEGISILNNKLFHTVFQLPAQIPPGRYTIEIMSFKNGNLIAMQAIPLLIQRIGIEAYIYSIHRNEPFMYGLICVVATVCSGLLYKIFFKD